MNKCAVIINHTLPLGLIANASAVLALSIGNRVDGIIGEDLMDKDGGLHRGITTIPIPLLKGDPERIKQIREDLLKKEDQDLFWVDFCDTAQQSKTYEEYQSLLKNRSAEEHSYLGIALYGPAKKINSITGCLSLLR